MYKLERRLSQDITLSGNLSWTCPSPELWETNVCCSSHLVCGNLLQQFMLSKTGGGVGRERGGGEERERERERTGYLIFDTQCKMKMQTPCSKVSSQQQRTIKPSMVPCETAQVSCPRIWPQGEMMMIVTSATKVIYTKLNKSTILKQVLK